jgi:hypothetical protein
VVSSNWREVYCRQLLSPPRLRTPAFADGAETCRGPLQGDVTGSRTLYKLIRSVNSKGESNMKDDTEDYPVSYLLYVSGSVVAIALVAAVAWVFLS